jgi:hypothetical protein
MKPESKKLLQEMSKSPYGRALEEFIEEQLEIINDVSTCTSWDEVLGRKETAKSLKKLMSFITTKEIPEKIKSQYI